MLRSMRAVAFTAALPPRLARGILLLANTKNTRLHAHVDNVPSTSNGDGYIKAGVSFPRCPVHSPSFWVIVSTISCNRAHAAFECADTFRSHQSAENLQDRPTNRLDLTGLHLRLRDFPFESVKVRFPVLANGSSPPSY